MKNRFFAMCVAFLAITTLYAYDFKSGDLYYNITSSSTVEVTYTEIYSPNNYRGLISADIPKSVSYKGTNYRVTSIGMRAFAWCEGLISITIPNSVTSIGEYAFLTCSGLTSITIPNSVTSIESGAFSKCTGLTSVTIGNSVTSIGQGAFSSTPWFENMQDGVIYIGSVLYGYKGDMPQGTSIVVKNGVRSIVDFAFSDCSGLTSVTIGNSVTSIGRFAFSGCSSLTSVEWNAKNCADFSDGDPFNNIRSQITSFVFGDSVQYIPAHICWDMNNLTSIIIPNSVTSIGGDAFSSCSGLTSITIGIGVTSIGQGAFFDCSGLISITIPHSVTSIGWRAFSDCSGLISVTIGNGVTRIVDQAFSGCSGLTSIAIGNSVTSIAKYAFLGCSSLTSVVWNAKKCADFTSSSTPFYYSGGSSNYFDLRSQITSFVFGDSVQHIPAYICDGMNNLTSVTIPNNVMSIGESAFRGCRGLTSIVWNAKNYADFTNSSTPFYKSGTSSFDLRSQISSFAFGDSVQYIPAYICNGMNNLISVTIPNNVTSIGSSAFNGCTNLTKTNYTGNIASWYNIKFGTNANPIKCSRNFFINDTLLTDLVIPEEITIINNAFRYDTCLTSVTIPNSVTSIGSSAFSGCSGLTSVIIGSSVTSIGESAFYGCSDLTSVTIPNSVTSIGGSAFSGCSGLTSVTIPNSVTSIGDYAFLGCSGLTSVTIPNNVTSIGDGAFEDCSGLTSFTIPNSVTSIGEYAFRGCSSLTSVVWNAKKYVDFTSSRTPFYYYYYSGSSDNFDLRSQITSFVFGDSVQHIPAYICDGMDSLTSVTIPNNVTSIGESAFRGCSGLISIVWNAKNYADFTSSRTPFYHYYYSGSSNNFDLRSQITSFVFGDNVQHIPAYICDGMNNLTSITIGNSVTGIGSSAFNGCTNLTKTNYTGDIAGWYNMDFSTNANPIEYSRNFFINDTLVTDLVIPEEITTINDAFRNDTCLTSVTILNSVTSIGADAFRDCSGLKSITIGNNVMSIGNSAFLGCSSLTSVAWNAKKYADFTSSSTPFYYYYYRGSSDNFDLRSQITSFVFGDSVQHIPAYICDGMNNLTSISIPNSVTSIGNNAFSDCNKIASIVIPNDVNRIGNSAFSGCSGLTSVVWKAKKCTGWNNNN